MKYIVLTGGPGAGKTAILEMSRKILSPEATILPEAASIVFGGGFPRLSSISGRSASQRAIYHVQVELERMMKDENLWNMAVCDRGTLDSLAYWPNGEASFWEMAQTTYKDELEKYFAVIHLRSPTAMQGYNHSNPLRTESALESMKIDERIAEIWKAHKRYHSIEATENFLNKAQIALDLISFYQK